MTETAEVPVPTKTGSDGTQSRTGATEPTIVPDVPTADLPIVRQITGLASHARAFGGDAQTALVLGTTLQLQQDLKDARTEIRSLNSKVDEARDRVSELRVQNGILQSEIKYERDNRNLRNLMIFLGTAIIGVALELLKNGLSGMAAAVTLVGLIAMFLGWFGPPGVKK